MNPGKTALIGTINKNFEELQQGIERLRCLVVSLLEHQPDDFMSIPSLELCPYKSRENILREAIKEAIPVLEESRKAFKSKRLEALRKKLTQILVDSG